ncbi:MAG: 3-dehydroquinate synthase [Oscillospiraceae bacterium]|nr:3-dehydroquinate synthase [Oscillospiraceae bacterium]
MKNFVIPVHATSGSYEVKVGSGLLPTLGSEMKSLGLSGRCVVVSGENVFPIYGQTVLKSLREAGFRTDSVAFPAGENTKSLERYGELMNFLTKKQLSRSDCLVALGGGVTGDLTGFAAATYQRGIRFVQVPTTLLAAVDSSVGGKTAINLPAAKNQVGAFYQPRLVLCDTDTLKTLPEREKRAGLAEVIKMAVLADPDLFDLLQRLDPSIPPDALPEAIEACVRMKAEIVEEDERDLGKRRLLNLGHSFGHAVEQKSGYALLHGEAVAVGIAMACRAAAHLGMLDEGSLAAIIELLQRFGLPTETEYSAEDLFSILLLDKKIADGKMHLVLPKSIGWCEIVPVSRDELRHLLAAACGEEA